MRIIEIDALSNGAHKNQNGDLNTVPFGWAMIPDDMEIPATFPFVNIEVEGQTVISMTEGVVPEFPIATLSLEDEGEDDIPTKIAALESRIAELEHRLEEM